jgi:hypothetical protein
MTPIAPLPERVLHWTRNIGIEGSKNNNIGIGKREIP